MQIGITMFATDRSIGAPELARAAEERGFSSLFLPEHTHIPTSRGTPWPGGGELPDEYRRSVDPLVALAAAATVTTRIRLGTGICLVAQREPIVTAKAVATLDVVSGGRFTFGIGYGWNREEMEDHGVDPRRRRDVVREKVLAMEALWRDEAASFHGDHVSLDESWSWPKPVQAPRPPVMIGGAAGPTLFAHVAEYADGWIPIGGAGVREALPRLHRAVEEAGRDPAEVRIVPFGTVPDRGKLDYYEEIGITEVVANVPSGPAADVLPALDAIAPLIG
ncbi:MAG: TIGR03619 family F420-dependent LLM class oxidoreductase [Acidimicrobiia bacterium]|nr:TIGR03619 family F420-dependent LLM class oxidoreductase [Acidimicrobiia bacterium]